MILYSRQHIAILEHNKDKSNFMAIVRHVSKHDKILQYHLDNTVSTFNHIIKYTSPDIQNKIIEISGEMVRQAL